MSPKPGRDYVGIATPFYCHDGDGNLLLQKRGSGARDEVGRWDPGGGKMEKGLGLEENVKKEVREELGVECIVEEQLPAHSSFPEKDGEESQWLVVPFFVKVDREEVEINEGEKIDELKWASINEMPEPLHSGFKDTFQSYRGRFEEKLEERRNVKKLRFYPSLPQKILNGEKDTTWRIGDEKNIQTGDEIRLLNPEEKDREFARAKVLWTKKTTFGRLSEEDREGHESFESEEEMYETYSGYYDTEVGPETEVKVVKFELVQ